MSEKSKRLMMIYSRLKSGPVTIEMLTSWAKKNDIQISTRAFYRDLNDLENSVILPNEKLVIAVGEKNRKTWKIEYINEEEPLTVFDINSYILFQNFLPLSVITTREKSLEKIRSLFYHQYSKSQFENFVNVAKQQIQASHFFEGTFVQDHHKILDDCIWSIQNKRKMEILAIKFDFNDSSPEIVFPQTFLPIQILYHRGIVNVSGFLSKNNQLVFWGVDQISNYKLTNEPFDNTGCLEELEKEMTKRFGISKNINSEVYDIEIEFTEMLGTFVSNLIWHPTQEFQQVENGNYLMKMKCGVNIELVSWIFEWMSDAKILKPEILKTAVVDKLKLMFTNYDEDFTRSHSTNFQDHVLVDRK